MDHIQEWKGSIGQTKTDELAVMVDTFAPLKITKKRRFIRWKVS